MDNIKLQSILVGIGSGIIFWILNAWLCMINSYYTNAVAESYSYYFWHSVNFFLVLLIGIIMGIALYMYRNIIDRTPLKISNTSLSSDKKKAKYKWPPKKYLSKNPEYLTIGTVGKGVFKRFVNIPFFQSPNMMLCFGAPGSGKTAIFLNLLIHNFNYGIEQNTNPISKFKSVLAVDIKPELSKKSVDEDLPNIKTIRPFSIKSKFGFDALYGLTQDSTDDQLKTRFQLIAKCCVPSLSGDNEYFSTSAQTLMVAFLMHSFRHGLGLGEAMVKIKAVRIEDYIAEIILDPQMKNHPKIVNLVKQFSGDASDSFKSIQTSLIKDISIFDTDSVIYCFDKNPNRVTPKDLIEGNSVFLQISDHLLQDYRIILSLILELCAREVLKQKEEDLIDENPILFLIDEAGVVKIPNLNGYLATGRSKKLQIILMAQSMQQLVHLYGKENAETIVDCCKTILLLSNYNVDECKKHAERCGTYRETKVSSKIGNGFLSNINDGKNVSEEYRNCMDIYDIQMLEENNEILVFDKGLWFIASKAMYFNIPEYDCLSKEIASKNAKNYSDEGDK